MKKIIYFTTLCLLSLNINAQDSASSKSLKWLRSFKKGNTTFSFGIGNLQPEAVALSNYHNYEGLQGDYKGENSGLISVGLDYHKRDNYMMGLYYSYFSAKSGTWVDEKNFQLNYFKMAVHQLTAKYSYGWYNNYDFGGVLYSGFSISIRAISKETVYPDAILVSNPAKFPYDFGVTSGHITLLGFKGRFTKKGKLGTYIELGFGNMGILNYGLNYTL